MTCSEDVVLISDSCQLIQTGLSDTAGSLSRNLQLCQDQVPVEQDEQSTSYFKLISNVQDLEKLSA